MPWLLTINLSETRSWAYQPKKISTTDQVQVESNSTEQLLKRCLIEFICTITLCFNKYQTSPSLELLIKEHSPCILITRLRQLHGPRLFLFHQVRLLIMTSRVDQSQPLDSGQNMTVTPQARTAPSEKVEVPTYLAQKVAARLQLILNSKPHLEPAETLTGTTQVKLMDGPSLTTWSSTATVIQITLVN